MISGAAIAAEPIAARLARSGAFAGTSSVAVNATVTNEQRLYAATREFITGATDVPRQLPFPGTLVRPLRFDRSIMDGSGIGRVTMGWGEVELANAEGDYDAAADGFSVDGRRVTIRARRRGDPFSASSILFDGTASDWHIDEDIVRLSLRDNSYKLEVPAQPLVYGGTGDIDGTEDLKGKRKPLAFGYAENITPVLLVPASLLYQASSGPIQSVVAVYDRGVALVSAGDYSTSAALLAATTGAAGSGADIVAGRYGTCLAEGMIRLGGMPAGTVTCTVQGDATGGVYASTTATIVQRLILTATKLTAADLIQHTFDAVQAAQPAQIGYFLSQEDETTVADVCARLMGGIGGWCGMRREGRVEVGIFTGPDLTRMPDATYDETSIESLTREALPDLLNPPPYRYRVAWGRNWTVQSDLSASVSTTRVAFVSEAFRLAASDTARVAQIKGDHALAKDPDPVEAFFRFEADAAGEANRRLDLYGRTVSLYRIRPIVHPFLHEIGEDVRITYPRFGLDTGRTFRVVSVTDDAGDVNSDGSTELVVFG